MKSCSRNEKNGGKREQGTNQDRPASVNNETHGLGEPGFAR